MEEVVERHIASFRRLAFYLIITLLLTVVTIFAFHQFIAEPISLSKLFEQAIYIIIVVSFSLTAIGIIRHFKPAMAQRTGIQAATIIQYIMFGITALIMIFVIFSILQVSATNLLTGAGIISITAGLVISTFVGSLLSGFLVFTTFQVQEGNDVMVNSIPGKVTEMTALVMRIQTDMGQVTIPNSAIASGGVIVTAVRKYEQPLKEGRLHYAVGDRVMTSYMNEQGIVKQVTLYQTVVLLDSGKEITFLNNSVLSGTIAVAKITQTPNQTKEKTEQT